MESPEQKYNQYVSRDLLLTDLGTKQCRSLEEDIAIARRQQRQDVITHDFSRLQRKTPKVTISTNFGLLCYPRKLERALSQPQRSFVTRYSNNEQKARFCSGGEFTMGNFEGGKTNACKCPLGYGVGWLESRNYSL